MSDFNSLPVAPEFVESLADNCLKTAVDYLEEHNIPKPIIDLVMSIHALDYYITECHVRPETLMRDQKDRYDIENILVDAINAIAQSGGVFHGPYAYTLPREAPELVKTKKPNKA